MSPYSDALYRVVYAWALTFAPHVFKVTSLGAGGYKWDNRLGRNNMGRDLKVDDAVLARAKRADAAHQNGHESLLLFAPAVVAAISAGVSGDEVDKFTKLYLLFRAIYVVVYIANSSNNLLATLRTGVWGGSVYCSITLLLRAAKLLAAKNL
ncbi:uncharacterized protein PV09_06151 [Verruconis gallopava]|uniref:MAPEG family protein n=1 Tax=Verruconis gallopava TaxID=253628 RepID=A0A0D1YQ27_9PEZI|nr:uncharacterized protein PV09_06151 [Verruconis gallopava]KIW02717.1 hypothetical protein PV09_06151 [Verruconis gallopava]